MPANVVGLVFDNLDLSGAEKIAVNLLRQASRMQRLRLHGFVCMDDRIGCTGVAENLTHLTAEMKDGDGLFHRVKKALLAIYKLRRATRGMDVLIGVTPPAVIFACCATVFTSCKVIPWVHYDLDGISRDRPIKGRLLRDIVQSLLYRGFVPAFQNIIFVSEATRDAFARRCGRVRPGWMVLPNILDEEAFLPQAASATAGAVASLAAGGLPCLMSLGRLFPQKRWPDAIATAEHLAAKGWGFNMVFVGDGVEREAFLARVKCSPAAANIHFLGPDVNPSPALAHASALILTSLYEAWPTVILEAFLAGVPVLSYDCPSGPGAMLGHNLRGILSEERPDSLAEAVMAYFSMNEEARSTMRAQAQAFAKLFLPAAAVPMWEEKLWRLINATA
jgi:glycosyltransferase involved in cell wall biosynthesis